METNYKKLYKDLMESAKNDGNRKKGGIIYYESHHIVPEFMFKNRKRKGPSGHLAGNPNTPSNLVLLTFKEHLIAHYYLYEILKNTHYRHSSGSALQFFFTHATGLHKRQVNLTELDEKLLEEMAFLREIGIKSISEARKGKMPVVDAITRVSIGSVPVDHPKVLSGEWVHHSKGVRPSDAAIEKLKERNGGTGNPNYKEMTEERKERVFDCVERSCIDGVFMKKILDTEIKKEFVEFDRISYAWVLNNFGGSIENLISEYNASRNKKIKSYMRRNK